jgi:poly [ADP-ribose] polymerase
MAIEVDSNCPGASQYTVYGDFNAMLNQTNIGANNNKFYVIQLLEKGGKHYVWTRWGRVGETGQSALKGPFALAAAEKEFGAKFKDKSSNAWEDRKNFKAKAGKYALIEIDTDADAKSKAETEQKLADLAKAKPAAAVVAAPQFAPSALSPEVQNFVKLIFDKNMFTNAMASYEIDVRKMPLGQLSKSQVQKGFEALDAVEQALTAGNSGALMQATSTFYTVIPHDFGRKKPPVIATPETLQKKRDMLNVLADIEVALGMEKKAEPKPVGELLPNPLDTQYDKLNATLDTVDPKSEEFAFIKKYLEATKDKNHYYKPEILDVFRLDRKGEAQRFAAHDDYAERKLFWHGTNVAVVAAICGTGLRIMPHSGGRVGKGIYFASENGKSIQYIGPAGNIAVMFLAEVALGKEHTITRDDSSLKAAPKGFGCIVARGHTEPDPKDDLIWTFEGRKVVVPQGVPIKQPQYAKSSFTHSEYLVYQESQVRLRYALKLKIH